MNQHWNPSDHTRANREAKERERAFEAINKLIDLIRSEKYGFDMNMYVGPDAHHCGTAACIAGHCALLAMPHECPVELWDRDGVKEHATRYLGIGDDEANLLFFPWEDDALDTMNAPEPTRAAGIRVLEILRDEGIVDWPRAMSETVSCR